MILRKEKFNHMQFTRKEWERYNRKELQDLYIYVNIGILKDTCSYESFVKFCFHNSTQYIPEDYKYNKIYKKKKINI